MGSHEAQKGTSHITKRMYTWLMGFSRRLSAGPHLPPASLPSTLPNTGLWKFLQLACFALHCIACQHVCRSFTSDC
jgi:hypothetical protein